MKAGFASRWRARDRAAGRVQAARLDRAAVLPCAAVRSRRSCAPLGARGVPALVLAGSVCMLLFAALSTLVLTFIEQNIAGAAQWTSGSLYQPGATGLARAARWLVVPLAALSS